MPDKTILFDVNSHGLGHISISAPVINELIRIFPNIRVAISCGLPKETISLFVHHDFDYFWRSPEVTLVAPNALEVDIQSTVSAYEDLYRRWNAELQQEIQFIKNIKADLVVSNINYMSLAAAKYLGVKSIAMCCMNWEDMFSFFCNGSLHFREIRNILHAAYAECNLFLQPTPHMPMFNIEARRSIGPVARVGTNKHEEIRTKLDCSYSDNLVLYSLGGLSGRTQPVLPRLEGVRWLVAGPDIEHRADIVSCHQLGLAFDDIVASVDALVGKDSYGTVVEAACAGVRLVMLPRGEWPEEKCLSDWASRNSCFIKADISTDTEGLPIEVIENILSMDRKPAIVPSGVWEATNAIASVGSL